jgi:hypothetical protein
MSRELDKGRGEEGANDEERKKRRKIEKEGA